MNNTDVVDINEYVFVQGRIYGCRGCDNYNEHTTSCVLSSEQLSPFMRGYDDKSCFVGIWKRFERKEDYLKKLDKNKILRRIVEII